MKPINLTPHTLNDPIVKDGIIAIGDLQDERDERGRISGGMAVESYLPKDLHRKTIDLDYSTLWQGNITNYKSYIEPLLDSLSNKGYDSEVRKKAKSFDLLYWKDGDSFMIQHPKYSPSFFKRMKPSIEREVANRRIISRNGIKYPVISPEDLVGTKLHRILLFADKYNLWTPDSVKLTDLRHRSQTLRADIAPRFPEVSPREVANLRMVNDCYDVKALAETFGLNAKYFGEVAEEWRESKIKSEDFFGLLGKLEIQLE